MKIFLLICLCLCFPCVVNAAIFIYEKSDGSIVAVDYQLSEQEMSAKGLQLQGARESKQVEPVFEDPRGGAVISDFRDRDRSRQVDWEQDRRQREYEERRLKEIRKLREEAYLRDQQIRRERDAVREQRLKDAQAYEYQRAWSQKYMGIYIPPTYRR